MKGCETSYILMTLGPSVRLHKEVANTSLCNRWRFNGYGRILGINVPWALGIGSWHALASVLFPILITYMLHPDEKDLPWLNRTFTIVLGLLLLLLGSLNFLSDHLIPGQPIQLVIFLCVMAILIICGSNINTLDYFRW
jgi:hypothetical protein